MTLNDLKANDQAVIVSVDNERFQSIGILPMKTVTVLRRKTGCLHIRIGIIEWAIRDQDAQLIKVITELGN
jgi:Fe2+ transport system protein FeoA